LGALGSVGAGLARSSNFAPAASFASIASACACAAATWAASAPSVARLGRGWDQNLVQVYRFRLGKLTFVFFEVLLHVARRHADVPPNLVPHHLLGNDAVADVGLEVLIGDTLLLRSLLQVLHRIEMILLSSRPALDQLGFAGDPKLLAFGKQELLIDQIAQQIGLFLLQLMGRNGLLLGFASSCSAARS
jgi:hypothetical protein